ncbi:MAG: cytochrome c3 family protein [Lutibacter sp.]|nr:cytochrome c3 family protein [Lutibacter sp.]
METTMYKQTRNFRPLFVRIHFILLIACILIPQVVLFGQNTPSSKDCIECHKKTMNKSKLHGPVAVDCFSCHTSNGEKHPKENIEAFTLIKQGSDLCYSCHKETHTSITSNKYVHTVIKKKKDCLGCHEVHGSNDSKFVKAKSPDLCLTCHTKLKKTIEKSTLVHSQVTKEGGCIECHSPHSSPVKKLLVSKGRALCLTCHDKTITSNDREISNIGKLLDESKVTHRALRKRCTSCHNPHASNNKNFLKYNFPTSNYATPEVDNYELCFNCHDSDILTQETTNMTEFRDGDKNLHFVHLNLEKGRSCINCHNVHASSGEHLIPETVKFGNWDMPLRYISFENGGSCASGCHKELKYQR